MAPPAQTAFRSARVSTTATDRQVHEPPAARRRSDRPVGTAARRRRAQAAGAGHESSQRRRAPRASGGYGRVPHGHTRTCECSGRAVPGSPQSALLPPNPASKTTAGLPVPSHLTRGCAQRRSARVARVRQRPEPNAARSAAALPGLGLVPPAAHRERCAKHKQDNRAVTSCWSFYDPPPPPAGPCGVG